MGLHVFFFFMCRLEILHVCIEFCSCSGECFFCLAAHTCRIISMIVVLFAASLIYVTHYQVSFPLLVCFEWRCMCDVVARPFVDFVVG